jgi:Beta-ketoacyl synthase, N-terminal domain
VLNDNTVTVSGRPDILASFALSFNRGSVCVTETLVDGLYHAYPAHIPTRDQVLSDVVRRNIRFPVLSEFVVPMISTLTGEVISSSSPLSLAEVIIDMILTQPVNWDLVNTSVAKRLVANTSHTIELVNIGPGSGLLKDLQRALLSQKFHVAVQNASLRSFTRPRFEPIAIVGMALNMPGAQTVEELWDVLANGISTVSTVRNSYRFLAVKRNLDSARRSQNFDSTLHRLPHLIPRALPLINSRRRRETLFPILPPLITNFSTFLHVKLGVWTRSSVFCYTSLTKL